MHLSGLSRAIKFLYAPAPPAPTVWVLKPPSWALVHKTTYAPMIYGYLEFFGPQMTLAYWLNAISQGPKTLDFQGPTPSYLPL
jgi:hypothetical protein